jgi:hypothetical protein
MVGDKSGPYSQVNSAVDFIGSQLFGGMGVGSVLNSKADVPDPVTGLTTQRMGGPLGFVHDHLMKNKYEGIQQIKAAYLAGGKKIPKGFGGSFGQYNKADFIDFGNVLRLGRQTFIRKPGEYNFYGNMSGVGLDTQQLHKIVALQDQKDPSEYDWRNPDSATKVLTYGGAGAYRLDGRHVDYRGRLAGSGTGQSDNFIHMADRYFNGNVDIARQWLEGTARFRTFTGYGENKAAMIAHFETMVKKAGGDADGGGIIVRGNGYFDKGGNFQSGTRPTVENNDGTNLSTVTTSQTGDSINSASDELNAAIEDGVTSYNENLVNTITNDVTQDLTWEETTDLFQLQTNTSADAFIGDTSNLVDTWVNKTYNKINNSSKVNVKPQPLPANIPSSWKNAGQLQVATIAQPQDNDNDNNNNTGGGTTVGSDFQKIDDYTGGETDETKFGGDFAFKEGGLVQNFWSDYNPINMQLGGQPIENADIPTDPSGTVTGPVGFVDAPPSQVPEQQTIADNQASSLPQEAFVLNAPAVQLRGESDVKQMLLDAFMEAKSRGLPIGRVDTPLYEKNVDVLLSKGEVVIPPELVQIIGKGKLEKLNNRGKREVGERSEKLR